MKNKEFLKNKRLKDRENPGSQEFNQFYSKQQGKEERKMERRKEMLKLSESETKDVFNTDVGIENTIEKEKLKKDVILSKIKCENFGKMISWEPSNNIDEFKEKLKLHFEEKPLLPLEYIINIKIHTSNGLIGIPKENIENLIGVEEVK